MWLDGAWIETRGPTKDEVRKIDGAAHALGFGDHSDKTYEELMTKNPKCAESLLGAGRRDHLDTKKFTDRTSRWNISLVSKEEKAEYFE